MTTPDARSATERIEDDALLVGTAAAEGLRAFEVGLVVLVGLLVCPPLAIAVFLVVAPLLVVGLVLGLLALILSVPYLLVHHFRGHDGGGHLRLLAHRLAHVGRALVDLAPHRIVAAVRKAHSA